MERLCSSKVGKKVALSLL